MSSYCQQALATRDEIAIRIEFIIWRELPAMAYESDVEAFKAGLACGLKMHKFKRLDDRTRASGA